MYCTVHNKAFLSCDYISLNRLITINKKYICYIHVIIAYMNINR